MSDQQVRNRIVEKMLRNRIVGAKNRTIDTVVNWTLPTHLQGRGRQVIDDMVADPMAPVEAYGGQREAIRLTGVERAVSCLDENDGNVPFGFDEYRS